MNQRAKSSVTRRLIGTLCLVMLCAMLSGCALTNETHRVFSMVKRTTHVEPQFFEYVRSDRVAQREARLLAEQAWSETVATIPNATRDFENGFVEGFADYLYRGGSGDPPVVPPRGYWQLRFLNQFGKSTINEWYDGFRHGAQNCKDRGIRKMWVMPSSLVAAPPKSADSVLPAAEAEPGNDDQRAEADTNQQELDLGGEEMEVPESPPIPDSEGDEIVEDPKSRAEEESDPGVDPDADDGIESMELPDFNAPPEPTDPSELIVPPTNPFRDDVQPDTDEDIFNLPTDGELNPDLDDQQSENPFSIRSVSPASRIAQSARTQVGPDDGKIRITSAELEIEGTSVSIAQEIQRANVLRTGKEIQNPHVQSRSAKTPDSIPLRLEPGKSGVPELSPRSMKLSPQDVVIEESFQTEHFVPNRAPPERPIERRTVPQPKPIPQTRSKQVFAEEFLFDDSLPAIPLHIDQTNVTEQDARWDPMEGIQPPRDLDFGEVVYDGVISNEAMAESTKWSPEFSRTSELPLRVSNERISRPAKLPSPPGDAAKFDGRQSTSNLKNDLKTALTDGPRQDQSLPLIINRQELSIPAEGSSPALNWRIKD